MNSIKELRPYFIILTRNPLLISAIFMAFIICTIPVTLQPIFVKLFINGVSNNESINYLVVILSFIAAGLLLNYLFDFVATALKFLIKNHFNLYIYELFLECSQGLERELFNFAINEGLSKLSEAVLRLAIDITFQAIYVIIIFSFLFIENIYLGLIISTSFILSLFFSIKLSKVFARLSRYELLSKKNIAQKYRVATTSNNPQINIFSFRNNLFALNSTLFLLDYFIFKLIPFLFLAYYAFNKFLTVGSITSILIYIGMLQRPYKKIVDDIKYINSTVSITKFIRNELEHYLDLLSKSSFLNKGLVLVKGNISNKMNPINLSKIKNINLATSKIFEINEYDSNLEIICKRSKLEKIFIFSNNQKVINHLHFEYNSDDYSTSTILKRIK